MINRKYFDDLCDNYKHDFDNIDYWYALVDNNGWIAQSADCPLYHEEADRMYVIKIDEHDPEVIEHLKIDPSRCIVTPINVEDDECPIPYDPEQGIYYGKVEYSYDRHLHCARITQDSILNLATQEAIHSGFEFTINGETVIIPFDNEAQSNLTGAINLFNKNMLNEVSWTVKKNGSIHRTKITSSMADKLSLASLMHVDKHVSRYRDVLLPLINEAQTVEEIESITWDLDVEKFKLKRLAE